MAEGFRDELNELVEHCKSIAPDFTTTNRILADGSRVFRSEWTVGGKKGYRETTIAPVTKHDRAGTNHHVMSHQDKLKTHYLTCKLQMA